MKNLIPVLVLALLVSCFVQCKSDDDNSPCICPEIFNPVCGDNGELYSSECLAQCEGVNFTPGFCPQEQDGIILNLGDPALDGCGWVVQFTTNGVATEFRPDSIAVDFLIDQLEVRATYRVTQINQPCGLIDMIQVIEIIEMEKR